MVSVAPALEMCLTLITISSTSSLTTGTGHLPVCEAPAIIHSRTLPFFNDCINDPNLSV